jgi:hypothetical protein
VYVKRFRILIVSSVLALFTVLPGGSAQAAHNCSLERVSPEADTICDNYHNPKPLISYLFCLVSPSC